jgi:hypothetical protein
LSFVICVFESSGNAAFCSFFFPDGSSGFSETRENEMVDDRTEVILIGLIRKYLQQRIMRSVLFAARKLKGETTKEVKTSGDQALGTDELRSYKTHFFDVRRIEQFCEKVYALCRYRIQDQFRRRCTFCRLGHEHKRLQSCS